MSTPKATSYLQAKVANEMINVQKSKVRLQQLTDSTIDRQKALAHVQQLAQTERDTWLSWCETAADDMAADDMAADDVSEALSVDRAKSYELLAQSVKTHQMEMGEFKAKVD